MRSHSRNALATTVVVASVALILSGCSGGGGDSDAIATIAPTDLSGTVSLWSYYSDEQADIVQAVADDFEKLHPDVTVDVHNTQPTDKVSKAIASGGDVDVVILGGGYSLAPLCTSGAFVDLSPYLERDEVDPSQFTSGPFSSSAYDGVQCSLPQLSDAYGLFVNTDLMQAAGYTEPPKTLGELESMALSMTEYNADGSIKTLGFNPLMGFYENLPGPWAATVGATWMEDGKSVIADDPAWQSLMEWQKGFVDKIGYEKLRTFTSGLGSEWSADNAFETGQVAMMMDGEWRIGFLSREKPDLAYETAPFPTGDDYQSLYGGGLTISSYVGLAKTADNRELAWALTKFLTTDTDALVKMANVTNNVPTTLASLESPDLTLPPQFDTFFEISSSPNVYNVPQIPTGDAAQVTVQTFWEDFQAGTGGDLTEGLKKVDLDINNAISLSEGP